MEEAKDSRGKRKFWIPVWNGIFEHRKKIKDALWLFLWYIDKTTQEEDAEDGGKVGRVLGGKPIRDSEIARDLQCTKRTVCTWRRRLEHHGYIKATRAPYGYTVRVLKSKKWLEKKSAPRPTEDTRDSASDLGGIVPGDLPVTSHSDSHVTSPSGKQTSNVIKTPQDSTKGNDKTKTNQPAQSDALVGRLALLFRGKTGKNLGSTTEQRTSIAILAHQNGQEDVIASFERWLKREPGMDRIKWPLAVFVNEYSSFSPQQQKRIESERREELAKQFMERNCPLCHTKGQMCNEGNGFVSCGSCGVVLDAAETHDFGQPFVRGRKGG